MSHKLLVESSVLISTVTRLNCCAALFIRDIDHALKNGVPQEKLLGEVGACDLLEAIVDDFYKEIKACVDAETEARKVRLSECQRQEQ